eukprot:scpid78794/ scgid18850/ Ribonuclease P/MRP protein subunit POP5
MVRLKHRYATVELSYSGDSDSGGGRQHDEQLSSKRMVEELRKAVQCLHGDYGLGCVLRSLHVKYLNVQTNIAIIRISRDYYKLLLSALPLMKKLRDIECSIKVLHLGGTIRSCQRFLIAHNRKYLQECLKTATTPVERAELMDLIAA